MHSNLRICAALKEYSFFINADCNYNGGDCCGCNINSEHCSECTCFFLETCLAGVHPLVGDGVCNDQTNNVECNYDGGDCCGPAVSCKYLWFF